MVITSIVTQSITSWLIDFVGINNCNVLEKNTATIKLASKPSNEYFHIQFKTNKMSPIQPTVHALGNMLKITNET